MDREHRHELKHNDLADWIGHVPQYVSENYLQIIGIALIIIALILWIPFQDIRANRARELQGQTVHEMRMMEIYKMASAAPEDQTQMENPVGNLMMSAQTLQAKAQQTKNPALAAIALIQRGDALRSHLHYQRSVIEPEAMESQIQQAKDAYQQALQKAQQAGRPAIEAMALVGLGLCSEELDNSDEASNYYQQVVDDERYAGTAAPEIASFRLQMMGEGVKTIHFVEKPDEFMPFFQSGEDQTITSPEYFQNLGPVQVPEAETEADTQGVDEAAGPDQPQTDGQE